MPEWRPEVCTTPMSDHGTHGAPAAHGTGHDDGHGHDDHGAAKLGPIDWKMWGVGLVGVIAGLIVVAGVVLSTGFVFSA